MIPHRDKGKLSLMAVILLQVSGHARPQAAGQRNTAGWELTSEGLLSRTARRDTRVAASLAMLAPRLLALAFSARQHHLSSNAGNLVHSCSQLASGIINLVVDESG